MVRGTKVSLTLQSFAETAVSLAYRNTVFLPQLVLFVSNSNFVFISMGKYGCNWVTIDQQAALNNASKTSRPRKSAATPATGGTLAATTPIKTVSITEAQHKKLKENVVAHSELKQLFKNLKDQHTALTNQYNAKNNESASRQEEIEEKDKQLAELTDQVNKQNDEITALKTELAAASEAIAATGAVDESKLNTELLGFTDETTKTCLFRTWKFIENEEDLVFAAQELIPFLPIALDIPEAEYVTNYKGKVNEALSKARQYVQSEGKKRAFGM